MTVSCSDLGPPPGCANPSKVECESFSVGLQDLFGDPPPGSYFWPRKEGEHWSLSFCFDDTIESHRTYATLATERRD